MFRTQLLALVNFVRLLKHKCKKCYVGLAKKNCNRVINAPLSKKCFLLKYTPKEKFQIGLLLPCYWPDPNGYTLIDFYPMHHLLFHVTVRFAKYV